MLVPMNEQWKFLVKKNSGNAGDSLNKAIEETGATAENMVPGRSFYDCNEQTFVAVVKALLK